MGEREDRYCFILVSFLTWQELHHKNKLVSRQLNEVEDRFKELSRGHQEVSAENSKMAVQIDEMRSVFRQKLLQFMGDQVKGGCLRSFIADRLILYRKGSWQDRL